MQAKKTGARDDDDDIVGRQWQVVNGCCAVAGPSGSRQEESVCGRRGEYLDREFTQDLGDPGRIGIGEYVDIQHNSIGIITD
jgi:hypothetical protein